MNMLVLKEGLKDSWGH